MSGFIQFILLAGTLGVSVLLILIVLMQDSKGGLGGAFGGAGGSGQLLGARGQSDLSRWTVWLSVAFFVLVLVLGIATTERGQESSYTGEDTAKQEKVEEGASSTEAPAVTNNATAGSATAGNDAADKDAAAKPAENKPADKPAEQPKAEGDSK